MKPGDKFPVLIEGIKVTEAEVVEVNHQHGLVELVIPGTSVVMGMSTRLQDTAPPEPTSETRIIGTVAPDGTTADGTQIAQPTAQPTEPVAQETAPAATTEPVAGPTQLVEAPTPVANNDAAVQNVEQTAPVDN